MSSCPGREGVQTEKPQKGLSNKNAAPKPHNEERSGDMIPLNGPEAKFPLPIKYASAARPLPPHSPSSSSISPYLVQLDKARDLLSAVSASIDHFKSSFNFMDTAPPVGIFRLWTK